jgi:hypothetical protein
VISWPAAACRPILTPLWHGCAPEKRIRLIVSGPVRGEALMDDICCCLAAGADAVTSAGSRLCRREDVEELYRHLSGNSG